MRRPTVEHVVLVVAYLAVLLLGTALVAGLARPPARVAHLVTTTTTSTTLIREEPPPWDEKYQGEVLPL